MQTNKINQGIVNSSKSGQINGYKKPKFIIVNLLKLKQLLKNQKLSFLLLFFYLVRNIEIQRQRDRQMELSNRAHVQFQEESIEDKEKSKYSVEASREMSR